MTGDAAVSATFASDRTTTGNGLYARLLLRVDDRAHYRAQLRFRSDSKVALSLYRSTSTGSSTRLQGEVVVGNYLPGTEYAVLLEATGGSPTVLRAKAWLSGSPEPADWSLTTQDGTPGLQSGGAFGVGGYVSGSASNAPITLIVDDFSARH